MERSTSVPTTVRPPSMRRRALRLLGLCTGLMVALLCAHASSAGAAESAWWQISAAPRPTNMSTGSEAKIVIRAFNLGSAAVTGSSQNVTITDQLPPNLTAISARGVAGFDGLGEGEGDRGPINCTTGSTVTCTWAGPEPLQPYEGLEIYITVTVGAPESGATNTATITGGESYRCTPAPGGKFTGPFCRETEIAGEAGGSFEATPSGSGIPPKAVTRSVTVVNGEATTPFGLADYALTPETEDGSLDTQAASHPFQLTTALGFTEAASPNRPPAFAKDIRVNLPPGLIGNPQGIAQCTEAEFSETFAEGGNSNLCPNDSAIGVASVSVLVNISGFNTVPVTLAVPVFNLVPAPGEPARFGFEVEKAPVLIDTSVRTGSDYGITTTVRNVSQFATFLAGNVTIWGVPAASGHRLARGWSCIDGGFFREREELFPPCAAKGEAGARPFLRMPTSCAGQLSTSVEVDSWANPDTRLRYEPTDFGHQTSGLDGCAGLPFAPTISVTSDTEAASSPAGLTVKVHQPQESNENATGLASADIQSTTVALPDGFTLNAASATGLEACSETHIGYLAGQSSAETKIFTPGLPTPFCPTAAKVGTVKIKVPVLANPLEGAMYLATQNENPFGSLVALYIVAEDPVSGVLVKLPGRVALDEGTGKVTATFENTPQAPIEDLEVRLFGGPRAALSTPPRCGTYAGSASFTPWSGNGAIGAALVLNVGAGVGGSACPGQLPFAPKLTAGTAGNRGGAFSPLTTTITRGDGEQDIDSLTLHLPPGLTALLSSVTLCGEAQANAGSCGAASLIGRVNATVGVGSEPVSVAAGAVYITGPYHGAPFGLSIVTPAKAGPFDLGTVIVRAALGIDRHTAQVTVATDPLPRILKGIPIHFKRINVTIDRAGFTINPTNCRPFEFSGAVLSVEGATAGVSVPFEAANCATLQFAPKLAASIGGHASKANGVFFTTKLTYPSAPIGSQANIRKVKVDLPVQLPTRLTTLNKACIARVFEANPASCPAASIVGHATARTPLLPVPLTGPAYLVSHGGEAFPALTVVLQGYGVTYELVGTTLIRKGVTSTSFKTVADVPVSSFELTLPSGPFSALGANLPASSRYNFCGRKLAMPTSYVAQNGAELAQATPIKITGCGKHRVKHNRHRRAAKHKKSH